MGLPETWRLPDKLIGRIQTAAMFDDDGTVGVRGSIEAALACGVCGGSGTDETSNEGYGDNDPCKACHGTGYEGVEWRCLIYAEEAGACDEPLQSHGWPGTEHAKCGLVLVVPLERSE